MGQKDLLKLRTLLNGHRRRQHAHAFEELDPLPLVLGKNAAKHLMNDILEFGPSLAKMRADEQRGIDAKGGRDIGQLGEPDLVAPVLIIDSIPGLRKPISRASSFCVFRGASLSIAADTIIDTRVWSSGELVIFISF